VPTADSAYCLARGETAVETLPGTATCCHGLPLLLLEWMERGRPRPYNRHPGRNRLSANARAGKPLQAFQPFISVAPQGRAGQTGSRAENRERGGAMRSLGEKLPSAICAIGAWVKMVASRAGHPGQ
jgi:hypothetical protein